MHPRGNVSILETVSRLARDMGLTRQSVQRVVNEMVTDKMLAFEENPHHKRSRFVKMTPKGEKIFSAALEIQLPWVHELSEGLSKKQLNDAKQVLEKIRQRLADKESDS